VRERRLPQLDGLLRRELVQIAAHLCVERQRGERDRLAREAAAERAVGVGEGRAPPEDRVREAPAALLPLELLEPHVGGAPTGRVRALAVHRLEVRAQRGEHLGLARHPTDQPSGAAVDRRCDRWHTRPRRTRRK